MKNLISVFADGKSFVLHKIIIGVRPGLVNCKYTVLMLYKFRMKPEKRVFLVSGDNAGCNCSDLPTDCVLLTPTELQNQEGGSGQTIVLVEQESRPADPEMRALIAARLDCRFVLLHDQPLDSPEEQLLTTGFSAVLPRSRLKEKLPELHNRLFPSEPGDILQAHYDHVNQFRELGIIANSLEMAEVFRDVQKIAVANSTVLLYGESGTGKELIARSIHALSPRRAHPFVAVNTGAIPDNLLEDELFGHVRGAFTSAVRDRKGKFEFAEKGTIFLDEISTMSPALQVKLLRVLQERTFERIGDNRTIRVDVRVVTATNQDLGEMVKKGEFRSDLFFRLNVIPLTVPPLRRRRGDIPILANYFLHKFCHENNLPGKTVTLPALRILQAYSWPGNVRELENLMERLVVLNPDLRFIGHEEIPAEIKGAPDVREEPGSAGVPTEISAEGIMLPEILQEVERKLILKSLEKTGWNKQQAAKLLGIKRTTLIEKMRKINR